MKTIICCWLLKKYSTWSCAWLEKVIDSCATSQSWVTPRSSCCKTLMPTFVVFRSLTVIFRFFRSSGKPPKHQFAKSFATLKIYSFLLGCVLKCSVIASHKWIRVSRGPASTEFAIRKLLCCCLGIDSCIPGHSNLQLKHAALCYPYNLWPVVTHAERVQHLHEYWARIEKL